MANSTLDELVSMTEASQLLGRAPQTLRAWVRSGRLSGRCMDRRCWVFTRAEIQRMAATLPQRRINPTDHGRGLGLG